ncbi:MAG: hypothetical protein Q9160_001338 [Pyrenula sp. 1 TL-2023]
MSTAPTRLSPAANLLRNSRLFSIPPPLPPPPPIVTSQSYQDSTTATLPYPTHAAIQTSRLSRRKGDWGLKRSLPAKLSRKQATQAIRIFGGIDTVEHIADYESAGDHVVNFQKWQALHLPVVRPPHPNLRAVEQKVQHFSGGPRSSVFESEVDNAVKPKKNEGSRWRFKGPWLQGLSGLEFDVYLKEIRPRKEEFREYLRGFIADDKIRRLKERAQAQAQTFDEASDAINVSDDELQEYIKVLRKRPVEFTEIMAAFLDIPEGPKKNVDNMTRLEELVSHEYAVTGPPKTHPSAGLSYLRSNAYVINHPDAGPQLHRPPIRGRMLRYTPGSDTKGVYGIAGVATGIFAGPRSFADAYKPQTEDDTREDPVGGRKLLAQPFHASLTAEGRIGLAIRTASPEARALYMEEEQPQPEPKPEPIASPQANIRQDNIRQASRVAPLDSNYGQNQQQIQQNRLKISPQSATGMDRLNTMIGGRPGALR